MNLARAQLLETDRPVWSSVSFNSGWPTNLASQGSAVKSGGRDETFHVIKNHSPGLRNPREKATEEQHESAAVLKSSPTTARHQVWVTTSDKGYAIYKSSLAQGQTVMMSEPTQSHTPPQCLASRGSLRQAFLSGWLNALADMARS